MLLPSSGSLHFNSTLTPSYSLHSKALAPHERQPNAEREQEDSGQWVHLCVSWVCEDGSSAQTAQTQFAGRLRSERIWESKLLGYLDSSAHKVHYFLIQDTCTSKDSLEIL